MFSTSSRPFGRAFLLACLALLLAPLGAFAATVVDRDEYSTTVDAGGGKLKTSLSSEPVNYQTDSGAWKPIDTSLETQSDGDLHPGAVDGDVAIPDSLTQPIELEHDGGTVSFRLLGAEGSADVDDDTASFDGALQGVDASYATRADGVKETLTLATPFSPHAFAYDLRASSAWSAAIEDGDVVLKDASGVERYRISAPLAWDSAADPSFTNALDLSVSKVSDGRWRVTLRVDEAWLTSVDRSYPVSVDPDFTWANGTTHFHGAQDCYLASLAQANYTFCAAAYLTTGYYNRAYNSLLKFDIASAIPSGATVSGATFKAYAPPASPKAPANHSLHTVTSDWDSNATWNNRKTGVPWTTAGGDISTNPAYTSAATSVSTNPAWYSWTAPTATVQGWVNGSLPNYGFLLSTDSPTGCCSYVFASTEASTGSQFPADSTQWPTLDVTWAPVDNVAPSAPSDVQVEDYDPVSRVSSVYFTAGVDAAPSGVTPSGVAYSEARVSTNGGAYTGWSHVSDGNLDVIDVGDQDQFTVQVRTVDNAGNVSATAVQAFSSPYPADEEPSIDAEAAADFASDYGVTLAQATAWLQTQDASIDGLQELEGTSAFSSVSDLWFDNESRVTHVQVIDHNADAAINSAISDNGPASGASIVIDQVPYRRSQLDTAASDLGSALGDLEASGQLEVLLKTQMSGLAVVRESGMSTADQSRVTAAIAGLSVPATVTVIANVPNPDDANDAAVSAGSSDTCHTVQESADLAQANLEFPGERFDWSQCNGKIRGGVGISKGPGSPVDGQGDGSCTSAFTARSNDKKTPYLLTAGHCFTEKGSHDPSNAWKNVTWYQLPFTLLGKPGPLAFKNSAKDLTDAGAIKLSVDKLSNVVYKRGKKALSKIKGVAHIKDFDMSRGTMVCMLGGRTGRHHCRPVLDTYAGSAGDGVDTTDDTKRRHQILIDSCYSRPGDSGAAIITKHHAKAAAINKGHTSESPFDKGVAITGTNPNTAYLDFLEQTYGHSLARCPGSTAAHPIRGIERATPADEAAKDLGVKILTKPWSNPKAAAASVTNDERVSITWDRPVDVDLHLWDDQGNHAFYSTPGAIPTADLSSDIIAGFGPETFVERTNTGRHYTIGLCYYSGFPSTTVTVEITDPDGSTREIEQYLPSQGNAVIIGGTPTAGVTYTPAPGWCSRPNQGGGGNNNT